MQQLLVNLNLANSSEFRSQVITEMPMDVAVPTGDYILQFIYFHLIHGQVALGCGNGHLRYSSMFHFIKLFAKAVT